MNLKKTILAIGAFSLQAMATVLPSSTDIAVAKELNGLFYIEKNGEQVLDITEGIGAFLDIQFMPGTTKNLDIGGGGSDINTKWLKQCRNIDNYVFDPYSRSSEHNQKVLASMYDSATLMSVLNVITNKAGRIQVLKLAQSKVKTGGKIYIRIYHGDGTGVISQPGTTYIQLNQATEFYLDDVRQVFSNVTLNSKLQLIEAINSI